MKSFAELRVRTITFIGAVSLTLGTFTISAPVMAQDGQPAAATDQAKADAALAAGRKALADGRWQEAINQFSTVLNLRPGDEEAAAGVQRAQTMMNTAPTSPDVARERQLLAEQARAEFNAGYAQAEQQLTQNDFDEASQSLGLAKRQLMERQTYLNTSEYQGMIKKADSLADRITHAKDADRIAQEAAAQKAALEAKINQDRIQKQERQKKIDENLRRVRQLQLEMKYPEALQVIDEILFIDLYNPAALALRDVITTAMIYREYSDTQRPKELGFTQLSQDIQHNLVVPRKNFTGPGNLSTNGLMDYPEDWPQLSIRRGDSVGGYQESAADRHVRQQLDSTRVPIDFNNNSLEQVVGFIQQVTGLNVYVDYKALNNAGINKDDQVSLKLQDVNMTTALDRILDQLGDESSKPQFAVDNGILVISSDESIRKKVILQVYDIRDLLFQVPIFDNAPKLDLDAALNQGGGGGSGGGGGGSGGGGGGGFGGGGGSGGGGSGGGGGGGGGTLFGEAGEEPARLTRAELVKQIVDIIQDNVDPEGWVDTGGSTGRLQELNGNLIITNTPTNHRSIEGLLAQLREIRALQINVESRFLTVATNWFEKIGVDLDLYFNTNGDSLSAARAVDPNFHLSDFFGADGRLKDPVTFGSFGQVNAPVAAGAPPNQFNTVPTGALFGIPNATGGIDYAIGPVGSPIRTKQGFSPIGVTQNHNNLIDDLSDFSAASFAGVALANPALSVGIQFLDDIQVDLLIEATQADKRTVVLTAPRLTFFNGQRAWVAVTTQQAFISGLTAITGDASGAFQPQVGRLSDGFVLDVEGVISADRRYVTMTVIFDFAEFLGFRESSAAEFGGAAGGSTTGGGTGTAAGFTGRVELPTLRVSEIRTTVSVPDKGTVLLGGQRHVQEIEVETGVPVLSKIPFINRFFTNRVTSKDEQTLLILIRPEIIIQQENEDMLFPGLGDNLGGGGRALLR